MFVRVSLVAGVSLLLLLIPLGSGDLLYSLSGKLEGGPVVLAQGAVGVTPGRDSPVVRVEPEATLKPNNQTILTSNRLRIELIEVYSQRHIAINHNDSIGVPDLDTPATTRTSILRSASHVRVYLERLNKTGEVLLASSNAGASRLATHTEGAMCHVQPVAPEDRLVFPQDPRANRSVVEAWQPRSNQLGANCTVAGSTHADPVRIRFYGMDLRLAEDGEESDERVRTGTFRETDPGGLTYRLVTRLLEVHYDGAPINLTLNFPARLHFYAANVTVVGHLDTPAAPGQLLWGPWSQSGLIPSVAVAGAFHLTRGESNAVRIEGTTSDDPPYLSAAASTAPSTFPRSMVAAGVASLLLLAGIGWLLYAKLLPERILEHPRRQQIYGLLQHEPGLGASQIACRLGFSRTKVLYHLSLLTRADHVVQRRIGGRVAFFLTNQGLRGQEVGLVLLRRPTTRRLYDALRADPGLDQRALAQRVQLSQPQVSRTLQRLQEAGLVEALPEQGRRVYRTVESRPATYGDVGCNPSGNS